jgi:zinc D-Ala-D-Ala carboxypeptidase
MTRPGLSIAAAVLLLAAAAGAKEKPKYGHRAYREAPAAALAEAGRYRDTDRVVRMRSEAAEAFKAMVKAAAEDGVEIVPISGFRTLDYQKGLFDRSRKKHGSAKAAARWVAPPGHSEHHTGWTLDLGDGARPETDVDPSFDGTAAFRWLAANAAGFDFELSFPKDNSQGVGYEPWHWRFVGTDEAKRTFYP